MALAVFFLLIGILAAEISLLGYRLAAYVGVASFVVAGALLAMQWQRSRARRAQGARTA